jgi:arylsulfatase A-like enzyme
MRDKTLRRAAVWPWVRRTALLCTGIMIAVSGIGAEAQTGSSTSREDRSSRSVSSSRQPNVLIVLTDDQRAGTLRVMPRTRRWFGRGGTKFSNAFATTPLCCPSRSSILTGRYAHNHSVFTNTQTDDLDLRSTFPRYLRNAGYRNAFFGKYLNSWNLRNRPPYFRKWAIFGGPNCYYDCHWNINGRVRKVTRYSTDFIARRAVRFLHRADKSDARPWSLFLSVSAPHPPFIPAERHLGSKVSGWSGNPATRERNLSDKPPYVRDRGSRFRAALATRRQQLRTLIAVDELVGRVRGSLRKLRESRNTLAIFLSDNGFFWSEHGLKGKTPPYTQGVQIPLMVRWPGHVHAGKVDGRLVANIDVAPTILDASGIDADSAYPMDGRSLLGSWSRKRLLLEYHLYRGFDTPTWRSIRTRTRQYIEYYRGRHDRSNALIFREYYHLGRDPWQRRNLLKDHNAANDPDVRRLHRQLREDAECVGSRCP